MGDDGDDELAALARAGVERQSDEQIQEAKRRRSAARGTRYMVEQAFLPNWLTWVLVLGWSFASLAGGVALMALDHVALGCTIVVTGLPVALLLTLVVGVRLAFARGQAWQWRCQGA